MFYRSEFIVVEVFPEVMPGGQDSVTVEVSYARKNSLIETHYRCPTTFQPTEMQETQFVIQGGRLTSIL